MPGDKQAQKQYVQWVYVCATCMPRQIISFFSLITWHKQHWIYAISAIQIGTVMRTLVNGIILSCHEIKNVTPPKNPEVSRLSIHRLVSAE